jgi:hypothetical protein
VVVAQEMACDLCLGKHVHAQIINVLVVTRVSFIHV